MSKNELENLKMKVEELKKKNKAIVTVINATNQTFMGLFDKLMKNMEKTISLMGQLPENIARATVEQFKKDLRETAKILEKARKNSYIA